MKIINEALDLELKEVFSIVRIRLNANDQPSHEDLNDSVITEHHLSCYINEQLAFKLVCTPEKLDALILGYLFSEGYIDHLDDIDFIYICKSGERVKVQLNKIISLNSLDHDTTSASISCGNNKKIRQAAQITTLKSLPAHPCSEETIFKLANSCNRNAALFNETGGTHCAALSVDDNEILVCEDIGRHNAVDKTIGMALTDNQDFSHAVLFTTGRIPSDMVIKAIRCGIPVIASHSAPTNAAIELARQFNLTLIGFVRGKRLNIYAGALGKPI